MLPYYTLTLLPPILITLLSPFIKKKHRDPWTMIVFFAIFFVLLSCRDISVGIDNKNYKILFDEFSKMNFKEIFYSDKVEVGFALLNKLVSMVSNN